MLNARELDSAKFSRESFIGSSKTDEVRHYTPRQSQSHLLMFAWSNMDEAKRKLEMEMTIESDTDKAKYIRLLVARYGGFEVSDPDFVVGRKNGNATQKYLRYTDCRHAGMWLCKKHTKLSRKKIASIFFKADSSTVFHAEKKISNMVKDDFVMALVTFVEVQLELKMLSSKQVIHNTVNNY